MAANKHATWKKFQEKMKEKRCEPKRTKAKNSKEQSKQFEELTVQRLSAEVHGKAQKYSRVGPREFVEFSDLELTTENIKKACTRHFRHSIGAGMVCDILAGDQGPSCRTVKQIPNIKLIHVRFIPESEEEVFIMEDPEPSVVNSENGTNQTTSNVRKRKKTPISLSSPSKAVKMSVPTPRSLSVATILKLGKVVKSNTTLVHLYSFDIESLSWSNVPVPVEFEISQDILGEGGFRKAYKATTSTKGYAGKIWVVKRYKKEALSVIGEIGQTVEDQVKKVWSIMVKYCKHCYYKL